MAEEQSGAASPERVRFVGRAVELARLEELLDDAVRGSARAAMLVGEPGIGKSSTAVEVAARARERGMLVLEGCGYEGEGAPPLWQWVQVLRAAAEEGALASLEGLDPFTVAVVATLVREVARTVPSLPEVPRLEPAAERFRLLDAAGRLLRALARTRPLLIVLEDLHWADLASLLLLRLLVTQRADARLLILGTYREMDGRRDGEAPRLLADVERLPRSARLGLSGLPMAECDQLTARLAPGLSAALRHRIWQESDGNPFFIQELARHFAEHGSATDAPSVPESLRDLLGQRVQGLPDLARTALRAAAVIGREFDTALLARVVAAYDPAADPISLADALESAVRARLIERTHGMVRLRFAHALQRDALYEDLPGRTRIELHRLVATAIEELYAGDLDSRLADLAHHSFEAALSGAAEQATNYARRAASEASRLCAFDDAARHLANALVALDLTEQPSERVRCEILLALGDAQFLLGDTSAARAHFERAMQIARHLGEATLFGRAVFAMHGVWGTVGAADLRYARLLDEALRGLPGDEHELRVCLMGRLATELYFTPEQERREALGREMLALARRTGTPQILARALNAAHFALWRPDNAPERLALSTENRAVAERVGDPYMIAGGLTWQVIDLVELGRMAEAVTAIEAYGRIAAELHSPHFQWQHRVLETMRALVEGRLAEAEGMALEAFQIGAGTQEANAQMFFGIQMLQLGWHRGSVGELEEPVRAYAAQFPSIPAWRAALAFILAEQDKPAAAARELEMLARDDFAALPRDANLLISIALLADVCATVGDAQRAAQLCALAEPYRDSVVVVGNGAACFGAVALFLGRLMTARGDLDGARRELERALSIHERMGAAPHAALTRYRLAETLLALDDASASARAATLLAEARAGAERMGMCRVVALAERCGGAPPPPVPALHPEPVLFRRDGTRWRIGRPARPLQLADGRGLRYIAVLLRHAGRELLATDLAALPARASAAAAAAMPADAPLAVRADMGDAGEMLDAQARAAYRERLAELRGEKADAERCNDPGRMARVEAEIAALTQELSRAVGLGGRDRRAASHAERARINVTRAIRKAVRQIGEHDPPLAHHLDTAIRTGRFCSYVPDPNHPVSWDLSVE